MKRRRVKITGIGPVTPAGIGREEFWNGVLEPVSRVRPFGKFGEEYGPLVAAYIDEFDIRRYVDQTKIPKGSSRQTLFGIVSAILALKDAGISQGELEKASCAVVNGSSLMDFGGIVSSIDAIYKHGARGAKPRNLYTTNTSSTPRAISETLGITARTMAVQSACCGGIDAIGCAAALVAEGAVDIAICGGTEAPLHRSPLLELRAAGLTPPTTEMPERLDRPFDLWRTTGVVSEGSCMFVIEPESSPRQGYSYISGYAYANDKADDLCDGLALAIKLALADGGTRPSEVESINAWGPGHKLIDAAEARAVASVFGSALADTPVVSIKGSIGTPLGAAPAIQVAAAALGQRYGMIPPTVNWEHPDPACPLNLSNRYRTVAHSCTLINAHGLGGLNAALILKRC
jgi:3-oxoacyl-(acyl-carrier-protein) synthase